MGNIDILKKFLPEHIWTLAETFDIDDVFVEKESELILMILESKSIDTKEEKQNRFNLLPLMNDEQVEKLRGILVKEKTKLQEIEDKYEKKKDEIKEKYVKKRESGGYSEKVQKIKQEEQKEAEVDAEAAEDLLEMI